MDEGAAIYRLAQSLEGLTEAHRGVLRALDRIAATYDRHVALLDKMYEHSQKLHKMYEHSQKLKEEIDARAPAAVSDPADTPHQSACDFIDPAAGKRFFDTLQATRAGGDPSSPPPGQPSPPAKRRARPRAPRG